MSKIDYPVTSAIRFLRAHQIEFKPCLYPYIERGGTAHSAECLSYAEETVQLNLVN